jgi:Carboxypeptidase regulatory-like domain/Cupin domain
MSLGRTASIDLSHAAAFVQNAPPAQPVQQPPAGQPGQQPAAPAKPPVRQTPRTTTSSRAALDVEVTKGNGEPLEGVRVIAKGPVEREGETNGSGMARLLNLRPGTYRLRFEAEGFVTFEREVTLPASGRLAPVEVTLDTAPEPARREAPAAPAATPALSDTNRPVGEAASLDVTSFIERNFIGRGEPQKISVLGCTGYSTTRLLQVREPLADRAHADADETLFVVAGEATVKMGGRDQPVEPNGLVIIPRGTEHSITRRGRNPAILLSILSGPPCTEPAK